MPQTRASVRSYRTKDVSLQHLREVITVLRDEFGTPYPLATCKPFIAANRRLVLTAQEQAGLPAEAGLVWEIVSGQTVLREQVDAGEPIEQVAEDFDLTVAQLKAALAWEWRTAA